MTSQDSYYQEYRATAADTAIAEEENLFFSSFAQERLWFIDQLNPDDISYTITISLRLLGNLNIAALTNSVNTIIQRHEALRVCFVNVGGQPRIRLAKSLEITIPVIDLSHLAEPERNTTAQQIIFDDTHFLFDLSKGPLIRGYLLRIAPEEHIIEISLHHIIADQWSLNIFWDELCTLYNAAVTGQPARLSELDIQYIDYAEWQHEQAQSQAWRKHMDYWQQ